ncbi:MAG: TetR/AcrR family transcriptional regulator [Akkermansia sp.]|nr:TetR/AcrR family transcriptional regulator [Akkermansia sp.]MCD8322409.1 TetR/AcrR family transcriptional regulator [Oscillospiraceae bacterium]
MTKAESKYFNTARRMDEAFLSLMEKKDFAYITVTEICEKAGVSRSTFYLHYETVGDLLTECVEDMNRQFLLCFKETASEFRRSMESASLEQLFLITPEYLLPYLTYISQHKTLFKVVLKNPQVMQTEKTYAALLGDILDQILARHQVPEEDRGYMLSFYIEGTMGIVKRWLLSDCRESVGDIARIMMNVIRR